MSHNQEIKDTLLNIIAEMAAEKEKYVKNPGKDFIRNRKLPFDTVLKTVLSMKGGSLKKELYECLGRDPEKLATSSAFIQQRDKLNDNAFAELFYRFSNAIVDKKTYKGYKLYAVDGSDVLLWRDENSETFVRPRRNTKGEMTDGHNQYHINAVYDLLNKIYVNATVIPKPTCNERQELIDMLHSTELKQKTIFIADRGYPSYNLMAHFKHVENAEFLIRAKGDNHLVKSLPMQEVDIDVSTIVSTRTKDYKRDGYTFIQVSKNKMKNREYVGTTNFVAWDFGEQEELHIRIVRFPISDTTYETIFTSLPRDEFPLEEIKKLYGMRWGIETSFRELKYILGLINLHSKKDNFAYQEIFAKLTMYNFCERIIAAVTVKQCSDNKYQYQVNYTIGMKICLDFFCSMVSADKVLELVAKHVEAVRPGRRDKRKFKNKMFVWFVYRVAA